jgi:hypothetical protein
MNMNQPSIENERVYVPEPFLSLFEPKRYKAYYGGRGSGKSHSFATALVSLGYNEPKRILCAREIQRSIKDSVKLLLDDKIAELGLGDFYTSLQNEIRGANGTTFLFAGLGQLTTDQIKSMEGIDLCWVEESQTVSQRSLEVLIPTIRKPGSELWFSWNPRNASDPVDQLFRGTVVPLNSVIRKANYDCNEFFPKELNDERIFDKSKSLIGTLISGWVSMSQRLLELFGIVKHSIKTGVRKLQKWIELLSPLTLPYHQRNIPMNMESLFVAWVVISVGMCLMMYLDKGLQGNGLIGL